MGQFKALLFTVSLCCTFHLDVSGQTDSLKIVEQDTSSIDRAFGNWDTWHSRFKLTELEKKERKKFLKKVYPAIKDDIIIGPEHVRILGQDCYDFTIEEVLVEVGDSLYTMVKSELHSYYGDIESCKLIIVDCESLDGLIVFYNLFDSREYMHAIVTDIGPIERAHLSLNRDGVILPTRD